MNSGGHWMGVGFAPWRTSHEPPRVGGRGSQGPRCIAMKTFRPVISPPPISPLGAGDEALKLHDEVLAPRRWPFHPKHSFASFTTSSVKDWPAADVKGGR